MNLGKLLKEKDLPAQFVSKVVSELMKEGHVKGTLEYGKFVPEAFEERKRNHLIRDLRTEGVLGELSYNAPLWLHLTDLSKHLRRYKRKRSPIRLRSSTGKSLKPYFWAKCSSLLHISRTSRALSWTKLRSTVGAI